MGSLKISKNSSFSNTVIANLFIDEYMKDANDAQLKVYLYLTRMISANLPVGITDIADKFNHTEREVMRALKYWEQMGLMSLEYDADKNLCGIVLQEPGKVKQPAPKRESAASNITEHIQRVAVKAIPEKPSYSLDEMKAFKQMDEPQQLLFIIEQYLAKPLSAADIRSIMYIYQELKFNSDLIDYLVQFCVERNKREFRYIEKVAVSWAEAGIKTAKEAAKYSDTYDATTLSIMKALGRMTQPTTREIDFIKKWTLELGFSKDIILAACERTCLATDKHRFEYTDGILNNWSNSGVHHVSDITKLEELHKPNKNIVNASNKFNSFKQNTYDFSQLEREILSN